MSRNIRVSEPSAEMQIKIIRAKDEGGRIVVQFKYEQSIQDAVRALHTD